MAASVETNGPRLVGSVIDPAVLDGGETEPEIHLASAGGSESRSPLLGEEPGSPLPGRGAAAESEPTEPGISPSAPASVRPRAASDPEASREGEASAPPRGAEMRARLLARARTSSPGRSPAVVGVGLDEMDPTGQVPVTPRDQELALLAQPRARSAVLLRGLAEAGGALSANMTALVGTLLGLAVVASTVALAMHLDRRLPVEALLASSPRVAPSAAAEPVAATPSAEAPAPSSTSVRRERQLLPGPWRVVDDGEQPGMRVIQGTIGTDPFLRVVQAAGLKRAEAYRVLKAFEGLRDLDKCARSDRFLALVERGSGRVKGFEYVTSPEEVFQVRENEAGLLRGGRLDLKVSHEPFAGAFVLNGALDDSARVAGFEPGLREALAKALTGHLDLDELQRGDRIRVIVQETTVLGAFARYAGIEAVEILPAAAKRQRQRFYYFKGSKERGHYDAKGRSPYEGGWRNPVPGAPITSHFNLARMHPVLKRPMPHNGTDFGAPTGTPVHASSFGKVTFVGWGGPAGNLVRIEHPGEVETVYFHLSRFEPGIKVGDRVQRMQVIGYVGSTGRSTGPHLHFGVKKRGKWVDPLSLNMDSLRVIASEERAAFAAVVARYDAQLDEIPLPAPLPVETEAPVVAASSAVAVAAGGVSADDDEEPAGMGDDERDARPPSAAADAPPPAAPAAPKAAVFLTDKELLELQGSVADGEVAQ